MDNPSQQVVYLQQPPPSPHHLHLNYMAGNRAGNRQAKTKPCWENSATARAYSDEQETEPYR
jgi:hypothetical protein